MSDLTTKMGLLAWDAKDDLYNNQQLSNNWQIIDFHDHSPGRGVPIAPGGLGVSSVLSSNIANNVISTQHLSTTLAQNLGITQTGSIGRGIFTKSASDTTTGTSFGTLATADQVSGLNVASGGFLEFMYQALWSVSGGATAAASIFINSTQLSFAAINSAPVVNVATTTGAFLSPLATANGFLQAQSSATSNSSEAAIQAQGLNGIGGSPVRVFVSTPGTYNISVQYRISSGTGTITVQNRHLWAWVVNFN